MKIISAVVAGLFAIGTTLYAQGTDTRIGQGHRVMEATAITKADADKEISATTWAVSACKPGSA